MIPEITKRNIGAVTMIDLKGSLSGQWASRGCEQLKKALNGANGNQVIVNLKRTVDMDTLGLKGFLNLAADHKIGIIPGNQSVMDLFSQYPETQFELIKDEQELAERYGKQMIQVKDESNNRHEIRVQTVLGVKFQFYYEDEVIECIGIVTNLSENGFYIQYIDTNTIEHSLQVSDASLIHEITFSVYLPNGRALQGKGEVVHQESEHEQLGLGVKMTKLNAAHGIILSRYLNQQIETKNSEKAGG